MGKKLGSTAVAIGLLLLCWSGLHADKVLDADLKSARDIVNTRKFIMSMLVENLQDLGWKLGTDNAGKGGVNAGSMQAMAEVLPPLFRAQHKEAYADLKTKYFFKGAPASAFETQADKLRSAAQTLRQALTGNNTAQAQKDIGSLQEACRGCHVLYRGKR